MNTHTSRLTVILVLTLVPGLGAAQSAPEGSGLAAVRAAAAANVDVGPTVDGRLDEAQWAMAEPLSGFVQHEPVEGAPTSERTEVRFLFDPDALYVGAWLYDTDPSRIIEGERRRDAALTDADAFLLVVDTYRDGQTGFVFGTNPGAIEYDGQVRSEGGADTNWDGSWTVATSRDGEGWYAEMRIPFSTLRYGAGEVQAWGLNVTRYIGRKNEQVVWSPVPRQFGFFRLTEAGLLESLRPPPRRVTTVTPYVMTAASRVPPVDPETTYPFEVGADAKIGLTPSLALDFTFNTDFAQVEVDDQQVDLTRFNLFFPEKRPFFLENAGIFSVGLMSYPARTSSRTTLFHSRRIGVAGSQQVPITWGGRLSGRAAGVDVGLLHMRTDGMTGVQDPTGWTAVRIARELPSRSRLGVIYASRVSADDSGDYNRTYGVDARLGIGDLWTFNALAGLTESPGVSDSREVLSLVGEYLSPNWYIRSYHDRIGDNFNPQVGFVPEEGLRESSLRIERIIRPESTWMREIRTHIRRTWAYDLTGFKELDIRHLHLNLNLEDGSNFSPALNWVEEGLTEPFPIRGTDIVVPAGSYTGWNSYATFRTSPAAPVSLNGRYDVGSFLSGDRLGGTLGLTMRWGATLTGGVSATHNRIRLPEGDYNTTLTRMDTQYSFSPGVFLQALVQYSDQTGIWSGNVRFGWLDTAGTGLFIVYNERQTMDITGMSGLIPRDPLVAPERTLAIKFTRQFDVSEFTETLPF